MPISMHTTNHKHLTHQYKHHQQAQDHVSMSYANPHTRNNHTKMLLILYHKNI